MFPRRSSSPLFSRFLSWRSGLCVTAVLDLAYFGFGVPEKRDGRGVEWFLWLSVVAVVSIWVRSWFRKGSSPSSVSIASPSRRGWVGSLDLSRCWFLRGSGGAVFFCIAPGLRWRVLLDLWVCLAEDPPELLLVRSWEDLERVLRYRPRARRRVGGVVNRGFLPWWRRVLSQQASGEWSRAALWPPSTQGGTC